MRVGVRGGRAGFAGGRRGRAVAASAGSVLLTGQPAQVKLSALAALCTALDCARNDLLEVDASLVAARQPGAEGGPGRSMPPM